jgi:hypothetical protein
MMKGKILQLLPFCWPCNVQNEVHSKPPRYTRARGLRYDPNDRPKKTPSMGEKLHHPSICLLLLAKNILGFAAFLSLSTTCSTLWFHLWWMMRQFECSTFGTLCQHDIGFSCAPSFSMDHHPHRLRAYYEAITTPNDDHLRNIYILNQLNDNELGQQTEGGLSSWRSISAGGGTGWLGAIFGDYYENKTRKKSYNKFFLNSLLLASTKQRRKRCKD